MPLRIQAGQASQKGDQFDITNKVACEHIITYKTLPFLLFLLIWALQVKCSLQWSVSECVSSPSSLHDVLVYNSISEDVFVEELIGEEYQQHGHCLKQDAIGDVTKENNVTQRVHVNKQTQFYS